MSPTVHTFPLDDLIDHETEGTDCPCGPTVEFVPAESEDTVNGWHVVHHSLDGRELAERNAVRFRRAVCCGVVVDTLQTTTDLMWDVEDGKDFFWHKNCPGRDSKGAT